MDGVYCRGCGRILGRELRKLRHGNVCRACYSVECRERERNYRRELEAKKKEEQHLKRHKEYCWMIMQEER